MNQVLDKEITAIKAALEQFNATYVSLSKGNHSNAEMETMKEGFLLKARKNSEKILAYVSKDKGIPIKPRAEGAKAMLSDYLYQLKGKGIIDDSNLQHQLSIIKLWGNFNAHDNPGVTSIDPSAVASVYVASEYLRNWFFETYADGKFADWSKNQYDQVEAEKKVAPEKVSIPDVSLNSIDKKTPIKKSRAPQAIAIIALAVLCFFGYRYFSNDQGVENSGSPAHMSDEEAYQFVTNYYSVSNDKNFKASDHFASHVEQYITNTTPGLNPTKIDFIRKTNTEYLDQKTLVDKSTFCKAAGNDSVDYWRFWADFTCFRRSLDKFQFGKVFIEFGIDKDKKIRAIRQLKHTEEFTDKKPS